LSFVANCPCKSRKCVAKVFEKSKKYRSLFYDPKAIDLVEKIDFDFSLFASTANSAAARRIPLQFMFSMRARQFDDKVTACITKILGLQ